ncbi:hypothetical protein ACFPRL_33460 [Pseudoclavibacter helvolus]
MDAHGSQSVRNRFAESAGITRSGGGKSRILGGPCLASSLLPQSSSSR